MTAALKMSRTSPDKKVETAFSKIKPERHQISTVEALLSFNFYDFMASK